MGRREKNERLPGRVADLVTLLAVESVAERSSPSTPAEARLRALAEEHPRYAAALSLAADCVARGEETDAAEVVAGIAVEERILRLSRALAGPEAGSSLPALDSPNGRRGHLRALARRFPPCAAGFRLVEQRLEDGDPEKAGIELDRLIAGLPRSASDILWPPHTQTAWVRQLVALDRAQAGPDRDDLVAAYFFPVRDLLRRRFRLDPAEAEDVAAAFFAHALVRNSLARFDPGRGIRFRNYLAMSVLHFYPAWRKRGGSPEVPLEGLDPEAARAGGGAESDAAFEADLWRWRLSAALARTLERLRGQALAESKWCAFEARVWPGPAPLTQAEIAKRLGITVHQVNNYTHQVRALLHEVLREGTGEEPDEDAARALEPPVGAPQDVRFGFLDPPAIAEAGRPVVLYVGVFDAAGLHDPLTAAAGVSLRVVRGRARIEPEGRQEFAGHVRHGRYQRLVAATLTAEEAVEVEVGLLDADATGLDASATATLRFGSE